MRTAYTILFYGPEGTLIRLETRPCDDLQGAVRYAASQCAICERITIYADGRTLWNGTPSDALAIYAGNQTSSGGGRASLN
jgi:hypothetical protein